MRRREAQDIPGGGIQPPAVDQQFQDTGKLTRSWPEKYAGICESLNRDRNAQLRDEMYELRRMLVGEEKILSG